MHTHTHTYIQIHTDAHTHTYIYIERERRERESERFHTYYVPYQGIKEFSEILTNLPAVRIWGCSTYFCDMYGNFYDFLIISIFLKLYFPGQDG
jgi:hypothetical protein